MTDLDVRRPRWNPIASARGVRKRTGQVCTIAWMRASGLNATRSAAALRRRPSPAPPPSRATLAVMPGRLTTRFDAPGRRQAARARGRTPPPRAAATAATRRFPAPPGIRHGTPFSGSRMMPLANDEAARVRLAGAHHDGRQAQRAAVDEALARVVRHQVLADHLLRAVGSLRVGRRRIVEHRRQLAAEGCHRAREHDPRRLRAAGGTRSSSSARAVEVDAHAEVEIGFRLPAHHRGKVEQRRRCPA